jgi:Zn-dependent protease
MNSADLIIQVPVFIFAIVFHEFSHAAVAYMLGDPTPKNEDRLTLNPMKHLDVFGVLAFFIIHIGWAKPVMVNPGYFKDPKKGMLWVSLAGPGSNLLLALVSGVIFKILLAVESIVPGFIAQPLGSMLVFAVIINIMLAVFNMIPIPPLDGSKVLMGILPREQAESFSRLEPYGFFILLGLFYFTDVFGIIIHPISNYISAIILT